MFAKLYETNIGQILVKTDTNEDGCPEVRIYFEPDGFGVCSQAVTFTDDDSGWDNRQKYFDLVGEEEAVKVVGEILNGFFVGLGGK